MNAYFPLFIPESLLMKEAEHVEGFAPQVAWVTQGGDEELEEPLAVRPTSEAIIGTMYAKWIQSWRDLPVLINQWANVVRWEKVTRPVPAHDRVPLAGRPHRARDRGGGRGGDAARSWRSTRSSAETELAMPVVDRPEDARARSSPARVRTYSIEALMGDGRALQAGTSHNLGQNFAKAFDIKFQAPRQVAAARLGHVVGRVDAAHRRRHHDPRRRQRPVLPPRVAPYQVVIVPIPRGNWQETVLPHAQADPRRARRRPASA